MIMILLLIFSENNCILTSFLKLRWLTKVKQFSDSNKDLKIQDSKHRDREGIDISLAMVNELNKLYRNRIQADGGPDKNLAATLPLVKIHEGDHEIAVNRAWFPTFKTAALVCLVLLFAQFRNLSGSISNPGNWTHFTVQTGLPENRIRQVLEDSDGSLLVVTINSGIFRFDGWQFLPLPINQMLPTLFIQWVIRDDQGRLWIACNYEGIWIYDHGKLYPFEHNSLFNKQHFVTLFKDQQGQIWIVVNRVGLFCINGELCENMTRKYDLPGEDIIQIAQQDSLTYLLLFNNWQLFEFSPQGSDPLNLLYAGRTAFTGFALLKNNPSGLQTRNLKFFAIGKNKEIALWDSFDLNPGRSAILAESNSTRIWYYANGQIHCYQEKQLQSYPIGQAGACFPFQDRFNNIWFATMLGLFKYQPTDVKTWPLPKASYPDLMKLKRNPSNKFMFSDQSGRLWFTGFDGHLLYFDGKRVRAFQFPDSLTDARVTALVQDRKGDYWLGTTQHGVIHWDGKNCTRFFSAAELSGNYVSSLYPDSQNRLWIGYLSQLKHFTNLKMNDLYYHPSSLQSDFSNQVKVTSMTVDEYETIWFGTWSNTLFYSANGKFKKINTTKPVAVNLTKVQNLYPQGNKLWGTANDGVFCWDAENSAVQFYPAPNFTAAITEAPLSEQFAWITGDFYHTNSIYRLKAFENFKKDPAMPIYNISGTCNDKSGGIWVGSYSVGLFYLTPDTLIRFDAQSGLPSLKISAIYTDRQHRLWIGTLDQGLFLRQDARFIQTAAMRAIGHSIGTFFEDSQQRLWVGTLDHGLTLLPNDHIVSSRQYPLPKSIWGIGESPTGAIYLALEDADFARLDGEQFKILPRVAILNDQDLRQAFQNKTVNFRNFFLESDRILSPGLACWNGKQLETYSVVHGLPGHEITDIAETADGKLWVATLNSGLAVLDGNRFRPLVHPELNQLSRFVTLAATRDTALWILSDEGLAYWKRDSIQVWGSSSKIVAYHVYDIHSNRAEQLLFSDENYLYYFNQGDIQRLPFGFNNSERPGIMPFFRLDERNQAWFVSNESELVRMQLQEAPPIIKIKSCQIGTDTYDESQFYQPIVRDYEDRACAIEFFGYHSSFAASQIQYSYRTVKADKAGDWSSFGHQNRILYSALEPGKSHRFEIRAQTPNGLVSENSAALQIILNQKPFYKQSWFYWMVSSLILIAIALYFIQRYYRINQIINQRRLNPYVAGEPILKTELFFGRDEIINRILSILHNNSVMITGERRIGKTSLLLQLKKQLAMSYDPHYFFMPIFVDLQGVEQWEFFRALAYDILDQIGAATSGLSLKFKNQVSDYGYRDFCSDFRTILRQVTAQHQRTVKLVLLIDEADAMNQFDQVIHAQLRRIFMQEFSVNFGAIIAGTHYIQTWNRPESPWWNLFTMIELKAFSEPEARKLIQAPVRGIFKFNPDTVAAIIEVTQCKPYAIQTLCLNLINRAFDQKRRTIAKDDVRFVFEALNGINPVGETVKIQPEV